MIYRITQIAIILMFMASSFGLSGCNNATAMGHIPTSSISEKQSPPSIDNATSQSENITQPVQIIDVDKRTGKELRNESGINALTPEQEAYIQEQMEQKRKLVDTSQIRFRSGYIITVIEGTVDADILENGRTSGNDYYLIQFYTDQADLDQETRDILQHAGCILYDYVQCNAFYAKIPPEALDTVISLVKTGKARHLGRIPAEAKISQKLLAKAQDNPNNSLRIGIQIFKDASESEINILKELMKDYYYSEVNNVIFGTVPASSIKDIVALNFVQWTEEESRLYFFNNDDTSAITETETQQPASKWETFFSSILQKIKELWHR